MSILDLFCSVDAFWRVFEPFWERELLATWPSGTHRQKQATRLHPSEIMIIVILFQQSGYRTFKAFYTQYVYVQVHLRAESPHLVSYNCFIELLPRIVIPLTAYLISTRNVGNVA